MTKREKLSSAGIVTAAMAMIDTEGEKNFSMRKLAAMLNVDPMAIYHHHANKSALVHAVIEALMAAFEAPEPAGDWRSDLRALCTALRTLANKHPGSFRIYETYENWVTAEHRVQEAFYSTLRSAGFSRKSTVQATRLLLAYAEAFAVDEISGWLDPKDKADLEKSLAHGPHPTTIELIYEIVRPDIEADFEFGLNVLLHGLETELQA